MLVEYPLLNRNFKDSSLSSKDGAPGSHSFRVDVQADPIVMRNFTISLHFEMELASFLSKKKLRKPVFVYLAGRSQKHVSRAPILSCDKTPVQKDVIAHKKKTCADAGMILISHFDKIGVEIKTYLDEQSCKLNPKKQMEKKEK